MYFNTLDHLRQQMYGCFERCKRQEGREQI